MTMTEADVSSVELVPHVDTAASIVLSGNTPEEILEKAAAIAGPLADLIERQGLYTVVGKDRKTGVERRHVEVSGWQAAGAMLGALGGTPLHAETIWSRRVPRDDKVIAYESRCEVRTISGDLVGAAESLCSSEESNWRGRDEYTIKGMAETRAESRAYRRAIGWIISLAGFSPTPAEEMQTPPPHGAGSSGPGSAPAWAAPVGDITGVAQSLTNLFKHVGVPEPSQATGRVGQAIFSDCDDTIPLAVARAINHIADVIREGHAVDAEPVADGQGALNVTPDTTDTQEDA